jgi:hypothetical protein
MPGPEPGIHVFGRSDAGKTWMAGTSPAMTRWDGEADPLPKTRP